MMIRILSVLPAVIGVICTLLLIVSLYGPTLDASRTNIPLVPCTDDTTGCPVVRTLVRRPLSCCSTSSLPSSGTSPTAVG